MQEEAAVRGALALFGSTSPSYLILQSLDACNRQLTESYPAGLQRCCSRLSALRGELNAAALAAKAFFDTLVLENKEQQQKLIVLGPSPARISKISNTYRYRLAIKCKNSKSVRNLLMQVLKATVKMKELRKVQISIDLNPIDLG